MLASSKTLWTGIWTSFWNSKSLATISYGTLPACKQISGQRMTKMVNLLLLWGHFKEKSRKVVKYRTSKPQLDQLLRISFWSLFQTWWYNFCVFLLWFRLPQSRFISHTTKKLWRTWDTFVNISITTYSYGRPNDSLYKVIYMKLFTWTSFWDLISTK